MLIMNDKDLLDLGLTAKGDRLKLQAFCNRKNNTKPENREQKIARIKEILDQGKMKRGKKRTFDNTAKDDNDGGSKKKANFATLKFEFGWKHWRSGRGYVQQKKNNGGGTRAFNVPRLASLNDCKDIALNLFFPNGKSPVGNAVEMSIGMGNFTGEFIALDFTAEIYKQVTGFPTPRLYLLTRHQDDEEASEEELMTPAFEKDQSASSISSTCYPGENDVLRETCYGPHEPFKGSPPSSPSLKLHEDEDWFGGTLVEHQECFEANVHVPTTLNVDENDGLIGTSTERQKYFEDLEWAVKASLEADKEKEQRREERRANIDLEVRMAKEEAERLERLRKSRELRCPQEPRSSDPRVRVSVRHSILGVVTRAFHSNGTISGIYDWVGSLSATPEHFYLTTFPSTTLFPDDPIITVKNTILNMTVTEDPIPLCRDENEVCFIDGRGFEGAKDETLSDGDEEIKQFLFLPNYLVDPSDPVNNSTPVQLLEVKNNDVSGSEVIQSLEDKRLRQYSRLLPSRIALIGRHDVVKELLSLYRDEGILCSKLSVSFIGETALGDGVLREVFSTFWDSFLVRFCEGNKQYCFVPRPSLTDEDYLALGRIITHQFVLTGTFPVQVAEAQIIQALYGQVSEECLVSSFLQLLPERERQILVKAQEKDAPFPTDTIIDILSEYNVTSLPTAGSLLQILKQVSSSEMIHKPFFLLGKIAQGMGDFWMEVKKDEIEGIYRQTSPNSTNVTSNLDCVTLDKKEEQVASWLVRYLKAADAKILCRFLRFCTACDIVLPSKKIAVRFENMPEASMRPKAMTCFCSLLLPKGYNSFAHLSANLDYYLSNTAFWEMSD